MFSKVKKQIGDAMDGEFFKHNAIFFIGTMVLSVFNYLYYPVLSRIVPVKDFGEIQAAISLFMQVGIILTAYGYVITSIVSNSDMKNKQAVQTLLRLEQMMLLISILFIPVLFIGAYFFGESFKFQSIWVVLLIGVLVVINVPSTTRAYVLQGQKMLKEVSIGNSIFSIGKLILVVLLVYALTNNVLAALLSYIVAQLIALWYFQHKSRDNYATVTDSCNLKSLKNDKTSKNIIKKYSEYGLYVFAILFGLTLLYSSDAIFVRLFFDAHETGLYSGIASIARMIYFVTASVAGVLIVSVKIKSSDYENKNNLKKSLILVTIAGLVGVLIFSFFSNFFVELLVGGDYLDAAKWLPSLSIVMFLCSLNNLLAIYQIALRKYKTIWPVFVGVVVMIAGLGLFHDKIEEFINVMLVSNLVVFVLLLIQVYYKKDAKND